MEIKRDDLTSPEVTQLVVEHLQNMSQHSPTESIHALNLDALRSPDITFWSIWEGEILAGCVALKELDQEHGEMKSMRTSLSFRRRGVAKRMLQHIIDEAKSRGYRRLSLETGSMDFFEPARRLYAGFGFRLCQPFADYTDDPNSVFMTMEI